MGWRNQLSNWLDWCFFFFLFTFTATSLEQVNQWVKVLGPSFAVKYTQYKLHRRAAKQRVLHIYTIHTVQNTTQNKHRLGAIIAQFSAVKRILPAQWVMGVLSLLRDATRPSWEPNQYSWSLFCFLLCFLVLILFNLFLISMFLLPARRCLTASSNRLCLSRSPEGWTLTQAAQDQGPTLDGMAL